MVDQRYIRGQRSAAAARGSVFLVNDNFIGNRRNALRLLPELAQWQQEYGYPFTFLRGSPRRLIHNKLTPSFVAVGCRGQSDVRPKERAEVTLIRAPDLERDLAQRQVGLGQ